MSIINTKDIEPSDLGRMYDNIHYTYDLSTNSLKEKAKKLGKIAIGILFLIGALFSYPFTHSNKISNTFEQRFLPFNPRETDAREPSAPLLPGPKQYVGPPTGEPPALPAEDGAPPIYDEAFSQPQAIDLETIRATEDGRARTQYRMEFPSLLTAPLETDPPNRFRIRPNARDNMSLERAKEQQGNPHLRLDPPGSKISRPLPIWKLDIWRKEEERMKRENRYVQREVVREVKKLSYAHAKELRKVAGQQRKLELLSQPFIPGVAKPQPPRAIPRRDTAITVRLSPQEQAELPWRPRVDRLDV